MPAAEMLRLRYFLLVNIFNFLLKIFSPTFSRMWNRSLGASFMSKNSAQPPVKSTMASQVVPPFSASYDPINLAYAFSNNALQNSL